MVLLFIAVLLFDIVHLVPALPAVKARLQQRFGAAYGALFGVAATLTLLAIIAAWSYAGVEPVYEPIKFSRHINMGFSLIAFMFLGIFFFRGKLRQFFRFPFAIAVVFWATGHLIANGDQASLILFGGLLIYALVFIVLGLINKVFPSLVVRDGHDTLSLVVGVSAYIAMVQLHEMIIGMPVLRIDQVFGG